MTLPPPRIDDPTLLEIAGKYEKTTPQVVLRWAVSSNNTPWMLATGITNKVRHVGPMLWPIYRVTAVSPDDDGIEIVLRNSVTERSYV